MPARARARTCAARSRSRPASSTWSAPTTTRSTATSRGGPTSTWSFRSLTDPSVAPPGKHVMSCFVQYAPYKLAPGSTGTTEREAFGDTVIDTIAEYAPNIRDIILHRQVADAARSRARVRADRRQHLPGRADARAAVLPAPGRRAGRSTARRSRTSTCADRRRIPAAASWARPAACRRSRFSKTSRGLRNGRQARRRHHRRRSQRPGHRVLSRQGRIQAARARAPRADRRRRHHRRIPSRLPLLHARALRRTDPPRHRPRHATRAARPEADHARNQRGLADADGRALTLFNDTQKSVKEISAFSQKDAAKYPELQESLRKMGSRDRRRPEDDAARHRQPEQD